MDQMDKKDVTQAVIIADSYNDCFRPFSDTKPVALMPLANAPMLDYALEALNRCGVEEVFIFASTFMDQIKQHVKSRIEMKCSWSICMTVHVLGSEGCRSMGDALRDLDAKSLLRGHFILMGADTITNAKLLTILEKHKKNCKFDKGLAMTVIYKRCESTTVRTGDEVVIAKEAETGRLLHHHRLNPFGKEKKLSFPLEIFTEHANIVIEHDLIDPQIAICSPTALPLFSDNFDFLTRDDFINGILINEEMLDSRIYCEELPHEAYAARCSNWQSYKLVTNDIINRWAYPLVPDMGICCLRQQYIFFRNNIYRSKNIQLARTGSLRENVIISENCCVKDKTSISYSVIGSNCSIGSNCTLKNAFLMDNVRIADNCTLSNCVIGFNAKIGKNVKILDCGIVGDNVEIPDNCYVQKTFVQYSKPTDSFDEFKEIGSKAFLIKIDTNEEVNDGIDSEDEGDDEALKGQRILHRMLSQENCYESVYSSDSEDDEENEEPAYVPDDGNIFLGEVIESVKRGYEKNNNPEFLILEINSSRYAYNMSLSEVNFYVVKAVFNLPSMLKADDADLLKEFKKVYTYVSSVLKNYIRGPEAMSDCLKAVYDSCISGNEILKKKISQVLCLFYNEDILSDEAILNWYNGMMTEDTEKVSWVEKELEKFIEWLQEEEEDEDSDDEED